MGRHPIALSCLLIAITAYACTPAVTSTDTSEADNTDAFDCPDTWGRQIGSAAADFGRSAALDTDGNLFVVGYTAGNLAGPNSGGLDVIILKLDCSGREIWSTQRGTGIDDLALDVAVDSEGNSYTVGFTGSASSAGAGDILVIKHDGSGKHLWSRIISSTGYELANSAAANRDGDIYVIGWTNGSFSGANYGESDCVLIKFSTSGDQLWVRQFGTAGFDEAVGITLDNSGNIYITGTTSGSLETTNLGSSDVFIARYDSAGNQAWIRQTGTSGGDAAQGIAVDENGDLYVAAWSAGDILLLKYDATGTRLWERTFGSALSDSPFSVDVDSSGHVVVAGNTTGDIASENQGHQDIFLARYSPSGDQTWIRQFGTAVKDWASALACGRDNSVNLVGFSAGDLVGECQGAEDVIVLKFTIDGTVVLTAAAP